MLEETKVYDQGLYENEDTKTTTKYETDKEQLRKAIQAAVMKAKSFEEFQMFLGIYPSE